MTKPSRRNFLQHAGAGVTASCMANTLKANPANENIKLGLIGCGQRGNSFLERVSQVCDPDQQHLSEAAQKAGIDSASAVTDFRRILDDQTINAVIIATPDHWHAPAAIMACEAGKHVYVEKPCSQNFREAQLLLEAAKKNNVVVQHGTQLRSDPFTIEAIERLHEGAIGDVLVAKAWNVQRRENIGHAKPSPSPSEVDYDLWVGPAEMLPFQKNRFHSSWRWWYNFGTGDIGNDGTHELDCARWGLGVDTLPSKVTALGGKYSYDDDQQFPDTATCVFEYPGDGAVGSQRQLIFEMRLWSRNYPYNCDSGIEFHGTQGMMFLSRRGKMRIVGDNNKLVEENRAKNSMDPNPHLDDFLDAIRNQRTPHADILEGVRSVASVHLANVALKTGRSLDFDPVAQNPVAQNIVGDQAANQLLGRFYRKGGHWAIPSGAIQAS